MANLLLEDSDTDKAVEEADEALKISPESLDAMAIHAAVELMADRSPDEWLAKVKQVNPTYGEALRHRSGIFWSSTIATGMPSTTTARRSSSIRSSGRRIPNWASI